MSHEIRDFDEEPEGRARLQAAPDSVGWTEVPPARGGGVLDITDTVLLDLTAASLALQVDDREATGHYLWLAIRAARRMRDELAQGQRVHPPSAC